MSKGMERNYCRAVCGSRFKQDSSRLVRYYNLKDDIHCKEVLKLQVHVEKLFGASARTMM